MLQSKHRKTFALLAMLLSACVLLFGCGTDTTERQAEYSDESSFELVIEDADSTDVTETTAETTETTETTAAEEEFSDSDDSDDSYDDYDYDDSYDDYDYEDSYDDSDDGAEDSAEESDTIDEDGVYTTKEDVALYIHTYGKLPSNFITKKEA